MYNMIYWTMLLKATANLHFAPSPKSRAESQYFRRTQWGLRGGHLHRTFLLREKCLHFGGSSEVWDRVRAELKISEDQVLDQLLMRLPLIKIKIMDYGY